MLLTATLCFCAVSLGHASGSVQHLGISLPASSKLIEKNRFQSSRSYDDTKKEFQERFAKSSTIKKLGEEINLPHVRAIFYQNLDKTAEFFGINIYLNVQTGLTEIFFLVNQKSEREKKS